MNPQAGSKKLDTMTSAGRVGRRQGRTSLYVTPEAADPSVFAVGTERAEDGRAMPVIPTAKAHRYWTVATEMSAEMSTEEADRRGAGRRHPSSRTWRAAEGSPVD